MSIKNICLLINECKITKIMAQAVQLPPFLPKLPPKIFSVRFDETHYVNGVFLKPSNEPHVGHMLFEFF